MCRLQIPYHLRSENLCAEKPESAE